MSNAITSEQRTWLKVLGRMVGAPAGAETSEDDAPDVVLRDHRKGERSEDDPADEGAKGVRGEQTTKSLLGIPIPLPESIVSQITIRNKSDVVIELVDGTAKLENVTASFVDSPPFEVAANSDKTFSVTNAVAGTAVGGTGGEVKYAVSGDAKNVQLFMKWERGGILPSRKATATLTPSDPRFEIKGRNSGENFQFEFGGKGGNPNPGPNPNPNPNLNPGPAVANVPSSCMIIVTNTTDVPLTRSATGHDRGNFGVPAPRTINANSSVAFSSVETPGATEQGCKGFIEWQVGTPAVAVWRIEWDNPEQQKNTSSASLTPQTAGFSSQDIIGQGEDNVPVSFTLSGAPAAAAATTPSTPGAAPGTTPTPGSGPGPAPGSGPGAAPGAGGAPGGAPGAGDPPLSGVRPFEISDSVGQGGKNLPDDVQQVQTSLNRHGAKVDVDGKAGPKTVQAIKAFQQQNGIPPDGLVEVGKRTAKALGGSGGGRGGGGGGGGAQPGQGGGKGGAGGSTPPGGGGAAQGAIAASAKVAAKAAAAAGAGGAGAKGVGGSTSPEDPGWIESAEKKAQQIYDEGKRLVGLGMKGGEKLLKEAERRRQEIADREKQLAEEAKKKAQEVYEDGRKIAQGVEKKAEEVYEDGKKIVQGAEKTAEQYYEKAKKAAQGAEQGVEKKATELYEEGKQALQGAEKTAEGYYDKAKEAAQGVEQGVEKKAGELYEDGKKVAQGVEKKAEEVYEEGKQTVQGVEKKAEEMIDDAKKLIPQIDVRNLTGGLLGGDD